MIKTKLIGMLVLSISSGTALAHAGHDHSHWTSDYLHIAFYASLAALAVAGTIALKKAIAKSQKSQKEDQL